MEERKIEEMASDIKTAIALKKWGENLFFLFLIIGVFSVLFGFLTFLYNFATIMLVIMGIATITSGFIIKILFETISILTTNIIYIRKNTETHLSPPESK